MEIMDVKYNSAVPNIPHSWYMIQANGILTSDDMKTTSARGKRLVHVCHHISTSTSTTVNRSCTAPTKIRHVPMIVYIYCPGTLPSMGAMPDSPLPVNIALK